MSNTSLVIILLVSLVLTVVVSAVSGISSLPLQAKAETPGQNQNGFSPPQTDFRRYGFGLANIMIRDQVGQRGADDVRERE